jgi:hypothetical protein
MQTDNMRHFFASLICSAIFLTSLPARADNLGAIGYAGLIFVAGAFLLVVIISVVALVVFHRYRRKGKAPAESSPEKQGIPRPAVILRLVCALAMSCAMAAFGFMVGNLAVIYGSEQTGMIIAAALIGAGLTFGLVEGWRWSWNWGVWRVLITVGATALLALIGGTIANIAGNAEWSSVLIGTSIGSLVGAPVGFLLARKLLAKKS